MTSVRNRNRVYVGQTALTITIDTEVDVSNANEVKIRWLIPGGVVEDPNDDSVYDKEVVAEKVAGKPQHIQYKIPDPEFLAEAGTYTYWPWVSWGSNNSAPGNRNRMRVREEGH